MLQPWGDKKDGWMSYHHPLREGWDEAIEEVINRGLAHHGNAFEDLWTNALQAQLGKKFHARAGSPDVGMFDSGIGGLSVYKELKEQLPDASIAFLGDLEEPGYSKISSLRVAELSRDIVSWLQQARGAGMTLVTCNLASTAMVQHGIFSDDAFHDHPIIPIVPPYREFFEERGRKYPRQKSIGIFATDSMCLSGSIQASIRSAAGFHIAENSVEFQGQAHTTDCIGCRECHMAVDRMYPWQAGPDTPDVESMLRKKFKRYFDSSNKPLIDYLVFGCTHFPILAKALFKIFGKSVMFVDPAVYQVKVASRWLISSPSTRLDHGGPKMRDEIYAGITTGEGHKFDNFKAVVQQTLDSDNSPISAPSVVQAPCADRMGRTGVCPTSTGSANPACLWIPDKDQRRLLSLSLNHTGVGLCARH